MRPVSSRNGRWLVPLAWMTLIFLGSTDVLSAHHTSRFIEPLLRWLSRDTLSPPGIEEVHFLIRKAGHLTEYAVLCILYWWALAPPKTAEPPAPPRFSPRRAALAIGLAMVFAATDEFHQSFVPSRGASVEDVLIDTVGAALGLLALLATHQVIRSFRPLRPEPAEPHRRPDKS